MLEKIMLNFYIAIGFKVNTLFWLFVAIWVIQAFLVWGLEKVIFGDALNIQWYDLLLTLLISMMFFVALYHMGATKEKV